MKDNFWGFQVVFNVKCKMSDHYNVCCAWVAWQTTLVYCDIKEPPSSMLWNVNIHICSETLWKSFRINLKLKFSDVRGSDCPLLSICIWKTLNWNHSLIGNRETKDRITFTNRLFFLGSQTIIFGCLEFLAHTIPLTLELGCLLARRPLWFKRNIVGSFHRKISPIIDQIRSGTREILCKSGEIEQQLYWKFWQHIGAKYQKNTLKRY